MGFSAEWLRNPLSSSCLPESALAAFDAEVPTDRPVTLIHVGVENGGAVDVWRATLHEGSTVTGVDIDPRCVGAVIGDASDRGWWAGQFPDRVDVIVNHTGVWIGHLWAWLKPRGLLVSVDLPREVVAEAVTGWVTSGGPFVATLLPWEEIGRLVLYQSVLVAVKSDPRVIPELLLVSGNFTDVVSDADLHGRGARRVILT